MVFIDFLPEKVFWIGVFGPGYQDLTIWLDAVALFCLAQFFVTFFLDGRKSFWRNRIFSRFVDLFDFATCATAANTSDMCLNR
ncbi:hypothetical protein A7D16_13540 [Xanthomonas nasturtii]|nr:hypothetical protein A7D16_13540 [Xanthomonas nasturtii]